LLVRDGAEELVNQTGIDVIDIRTNNFVKIAIRRRENAAGEIRRGRRAELA
jgi:hypothetical protein